MRALNEELSFNYPDNICLNSSFCPIRQFVCENHICWWWSSSIWNVARGKTVGRSSVCIHWAQPWPLSSLLLTSLSPPALGQYRPIWGDNKKRRIWISCCADWFLNWSFIPKSKCKLCWCSLCGFAVNWTDWTGCYLSGAALERVHSNQQHYKHKPMWILLTQCCLQSESEMLYFPLSLTRSFLLSWNVILCQF